MLFRFTDEQLMIQSMVREFSRKEIAPTAAERDRSKEFPADSTRAHQAGPGHSRLVRRHTNLARPDCTRRPALGRRRDHISSIGAA